MIHAWVKLGQITRPNGVKSNRYKCLRCGKETLKHPSQTERCMHKFKGHGGQ